MGYRCMAEVRSQNVQVRKAKITEDVSRMECLLIIFRVLCQNNDPDWPPHVGEPLEEISEYEV